MKNSLSRIIKKLNSPEIMIFLFIIIGFLLLLNSRYDIVSLYNCYYCPDCEVVHICAFDENDRILKTQLYEEIYNELLKNDIKEEVILDSTSNSVVIYQKNWEFVWFTDWCVYVANQALGNIKNKNPGLGCLSGTIYVYSLGAYK